MNDVATLLCIEIETGTSTGRLHPHNGYYAGAFVASLGHQPRSSAAELAPAPQPFLSAGPSALLPDLATSRATA